MLQVRIQSGLHNTWISPQELIIEDASNEIPCHDSDPCVPIVNKPDYPSERLEFLEIAHR